ncbi:MAG TPA: hypothetical protein VM008_01625 [Phycisphaerae bacterium]|nr:hypothetical protein [Phycisphaerae bacterium]
MSQLEINPLMESLVIAFESTAFISLIPAEPGTPPPERAIVATIPLEGVGRLHIAASSRLGALIAANIMALEPDDPEALRCGPDALKELLNVTAGGYCSTLEPVPEMGLPHVELLADGAAWKAWVKERGATVLLAEEHLLAVAIEETR